MKKSKRSTDTFSDSYLIFVDSNNKIPQTLNGIGFFEHDWFVKIVNNHGIVKFLTLKDNLDCETSSIVTKEDIFNHVKLPEVEYNEDGSCYCKWQVYDDKLYFIDSLPHEYYKKEYNPKSICCLDCFEKEEVPDVFEYSDDYYKNSTVYHERNMKKKENGLMDGGQIFNFYKNLL